MKASSPSQDYISKELVDPTESLKYGQVWSAFSSAGTISQQLYARIDIQRFIRFYSGSSRWALLDDFALTSASATQPGDAAPLLLPRNATSAVGPRTEGPLVSVEAIQSAVTDAANTVLGPDALEGTACP